MPRKPYETYGIEQKNLTAKVMEQALCAGKGNEVIEFTIRQPGAEDLLSELEVQSKTILRKYNLSDNWLEHADKNHTDFPDEQCIHAVEILKRLYRVKYWIAENKSGILSRDGVSSQIVLDK